MKPTLDDAYAIAKLEANQPLNGELARMSAEWRPLGDYLATLPASGKRRHKAREIALLARPDRDAIIKAIADVDPLGPRPTANGVQFATAADVARIAAGIPWRWDRWIPADKVIGIAAPEGTGKTRFGLDLCRRVWLGLPWPDNQPMTVPAGTPSLWLTADGNHDELAATLTDFGTPGEAVVFPAPLDDPYANVDLDSDETWTALNDAIATIKPRCVFIDSLTNATTLNLCEQQTIARLKTPLVDIVQRHQVNIVLLLHVSKEGQALGRRIKGVTRTLIHLGAPDSDRCTRSGTPRFTYFELP
jgi:hypothetical protein